MIDKFETTKLIQATQDGKNLNDKHPISELVSWAIANGQTEDFDIGCAFRNLEYAISQLENAKKMMSLVGYTRSDRE